MIFFLSFIVSVNGISPLLINANLVNHYRRYLNPIDPRMIVTNGDNEGRQFNKSNGEKFYPENLVL